jgi:hypothetical protein
MPTHYWIVFFGDMDISVYSEEEMLRLKPNATKVVYRRLTDDGWKDELVR